MAGEVTITVDNRRALAKIARLTPEVRARIRSVLPPLLNQLAALAEAKLNAELKTRRTLTVSREIHDVGGATNRIYGTVSLVSPAADGLLPTYLEGGTKAHIIRGNPLLYFTASKSGPGYSAGQLISKREVNHPGTKAYEFMSRTFAQMRDEIVSQITEAVKDGARSV